MYFPIVVSFLATSVVAKTSEYFNLRINSTNAILNGKYVTPSTAVFPSISKPEILYVGDEAPQYPYSSQNGLFYYYYQLSQFWSLYYMPDVNDTAQNMDQVLNIIYNDTYISPFNLANTTVDSGKIFEFKNVDWRWYACDVAETPEVGMQGVVYVSTYDTPNDSCENIGIYSESTEF